MKKILIVSGVVALALVLTFGTTQMIFARGGIGNKNGGGGYKNSTNYQPVSYVEKLKLTDNQTNKINDLIKNDNISSKILQDKIRTNMSLLREMQWSKNFDQANADKLLKEINESRTTLQTNKQKLNMDIRALLTTEQISLYKSLYRDQGFGNCDGSRYGCGCGNRGNAGNGGRRKGN
jgi:Spy/CpxP family protein refolding chaperone